MPTCELSARLCASCDIDHNLEILHNTVTPPGQAYTITNPLV